MSEVVDFVMDEIADARTVVRRPDLHSDARVLEACQLLIWRGDWLDLLRAVELHKATERRIAYAKKSARHSIIVVLVIANIVMFSAAAVLRLFF